MQVGHHTVSSVDGSVAKVGPVLPIVSRSSSGGIAGVLSGLRAIYQSGGVAGFFQVRMGGARAGVGLVGIGRGGRRGWELVHDTLARVNAHM